MPHLPPTLGDALRRGILLTPSDRAARQLRALHDAQQTSPTWQPASILPFDTWLRTLWTDLITGGHEARLLLNAAQEHLIWQQAIHAGPAFESMGTLDSLATLAASAWSRTAAYSLHPGELARYATTRDTRLFAAWAQAFRDLCDHEQYLSLAELAQALTLHIEAGNPPLASEISLYGFPPNGAAGPLTPNRLALLDALGERGTNITHIAAIEPAQPTRAIVSCSNATVELRFAARYLRHFLEQNPGAQAALLVPTLPDEAAALDSTLREILSSELNSVHAEPTAAPYAIDSTTALSAMPMIATALDFLRLALGPIPLETVSALLLSPHLGAADTLYPRATFDAFTLRTAPILRPELDLPTLLQVVKRTPSEVHPVIQTWQTALHALTAAKPRSYADWTEAIRTTLRDAGWPGDRALNASEFALTRAWDHVLDTVATLDFLPARVDFGTALAAISRIAAQAPAAPPDTSAPLQVLSPEAAVGCSFDAVVFLRATDQNWPAAPRANPLISFALQRERRMPGADAALAQTQPALLTDQLIGAAPTFLATYAQHTAEGDQRPSPLFGALPSDLTPDFLIPQQLTPPPIQLETIEDTAPIPPLPTGKVRGGAMILELQAACAFHAFAEFRLNANAPESPQIGFDPRVLGNFLHQSLDNFWSDVRTQANLRALTPSERRRKLETAIAAAARKHPEALNAWDAAYLELQKTRMADVLMQWLDKELERGPFEVLAREKSQDLTVGPLTLQVRLDRIDAVADGTLLVDYKTGRRGAPNDWLTDRPEAPQLPLYALLPETENLQGMAFAKVRVGKEMKWSGMAPPGVLPGKPLPLPDWEAQREEWRATLSKLANDFFSGDAGVSPREYPTTCTHCAHRLLCRISGPALAAADATDKPEGEAVDA